MSKPRIKRAAEAVPVPRNAEEAAAFVARIGEAARARDLVQAALDETVAAAKTQAEAEAAPHLRAIGDLTRGVQTWAEANRDLLCQGGRKTVPLPTGEVGWRTRPPSVRISGVAAVVARIKAMGCLQFLRVKEEVDKQAMLAEPEAAAAIEGVSVGSGGEDFFVAPAGMALSEPVASAS